MAPGPIHEHRNKKEKANMVWRFTAANSSHDPLPSKSQKCLEHFGDFFFFVP